MEYFVKGYDLRNRLIHNYECDNLAQAIALKRDLEKDVEYIIDRPNETIEIVNSDCQEISIKSGYTIGDTIVVIKMDGEPNYKGRVGKLVHIDALGQLHGSWGGLALIPNCDDFVAIE